MSSGPLRTRRRVFVDVWRQRVPRRDIARGQGDRRANASSRRRANRLASDTRARTVVDESSGNGEGTTRNVTPKRRHGTRVRRPTEARFGCRPTPNPKLDSTLLRPTNPPSPSVPHTGLGVARGEEGTARGHGEGWWSLRLRQVNQPARVFLLFYA